MTPVLIALFGILGTLAGVLVGGWNERRRWLRDKRLEAYSDFIAAVNTWMTTYIRAGRVTVGLNDDMRAFVDAAQRVRLLGPDAISEKPIEIVGHISVIMYNFEAEGTNSVESNSERLSAINFVLFDLVKLAQAELQGRRRLKRRAAR